VTRSRPLFFFFFAVVNVITNYLRALNSKGPGLLIDAPRGTNITGMYFSYYNNNNYHVFSFLPLCYSAIL
jgi:hypothetical protein